MRKFCDPFFFADVSSSAIAPSFQQVNLGRSEAPSELQFIDSERIALERPGAPRSALQHPRRGGVSKFFRCGAPCRHHREIECRIMTSIPVQNPWTPPQLQASLATAPPHHFRGQSHAEAMPNRGRNWCAFQSAFAMELSRTEGWHSPQQCLAGSHRDSKWNHLGIRR
jgi:hypothetical protein